MSLINVLCHNAGRHNFHFHDGNPYASAVNPSTGQEDGANCNTGVLIGCEATGAGGDNFYFYQSWWMTGIGCVGQKATGAGLKIVAINGDEGSRNHYFAGGDFNESNAGGNIVCSGFECVFNNVADGGDYTDTGTKNVRYAPVGTRVQDLTVRNILTSERPTAGPVDYTMIAKSYGNVANGRGAGVEMQVPNGSGAARVGGRVSARQETTNRDAIYLSVNNSGTVQDVVYASPLLNGFCPVTTNAFNLGHSTKEWNTIFLSSSGNGLRVNNVKVIGARGAALPADATDLASVIALANAIKARMKATGGHGLVDD